MKKILPFFSYLFHPILIPVFGTILYILIDSRYFTNFQYLLLIFQIVVITIFLPLTFFLILKSFRKTENILISKTEERKTPLFLHLIMFYILIEKSITSEIFSSLHFFFLGGMISITSAFILLYFNIKASIHMIGISSLTMFAIGLSIHNQINIINTIAFLIVMNGVIASSRMVMNTTKKNELVTGFFCGGLSQLIMMFFWL